MAKFDGKLSYKDWCILKHSLRDKIELKKKEIAALEVDPIRLELEIKRYDSLRKELSEEERTLARVSVMTSKFKEVVENQRRSEA